MSERQSEHLSPVAAMESAAAWGEEASRGSLLSEQDLASVVGGCARSKGEEIPTPSTLN